MVTAMLQLRDLRPKEKGGEISLAAPIFPGLAPFMRLE
jgi:hypothetical protein